MKLDRTVAIWPAAPANIHEDIFVPIKTLGQHTALQYREGDKQSGNHVDIWRDLKRKIFSSRDQKPGLACIRVDDLAPFIIRGFVEC